MNCWEGEEERRETVNGVSEGRMAGRDSGEGKNGRK